MVFSSVIFLEYFLPLTLMIYYGIRILPIRNANQKRRACNVVLLVASLFFYACGGASYLLLLGAVLLINYCGGLLIARKAGAEKLILWIVIILDFGLLFCFKYLNLFVVICENCIGTGMEAGERLNHILTLTRTGQLAYTDIVLPIGISFYIFQAVSYVADVYRREAKVQRNFFDFALYISFFPQLIAGPIVQYTDIEKQLTGRSESVDMFADGVGRFIYGLSKKVLIANTLAEVADGIMNLEATGLGASVTWLGAICYSLQIYYDFSGYSDMAIGLGKMFGFTFRENFNKPYNALSIRDFWRRWHISLSSWFKQYVYIPLGGSRVSEGKVCRNLFLVFLFTGIWHGANFTFLFWGLMYGALLIVERLFLGKILERNRRKLLNRVYTLFFVVMGWVLFRADNILQAGAYMREMFSRGNGEYTVFSFLSVRSMLALVIGAVFSFPVFTRLREKLKGSVWAIVFQTVLLVLAMLAVMNGSYNPFLYFQF